MPQSTASSKKQSRLKDILLLIAIPFSLIVVVAGYVYLPQLFASPRYDFIYSVCEDGWCNGSYEINNGKITQNASSDELYTGTRPAKLYYYDASSNSTRPVSLSEVTGMSFDTSSRSPDGYILKHDTNSGDGFLLFYSQHDDQWQLESGWLKKPVTLSNTSADDIQFLGWMTTQ